MLEGRNGSSPALKVIKLDFSLETLQVVIASLKINAKFSIEIVFETLGRKWQQVHTVMLSSLSKRLY